MVFLLKFNLKYHFLYINYFMKMNIIVDLRFGFKKKHFVIKIQVNIEKVICVLHVPFFFNLIPLLIFSTSYFKLKNIFKMK